MFWKKIVYTDRLADYRKIQCWEFHLFDRVIVETTDNFYDKDKIWMKWILVAIGTNWAYWITTPSGSLHRIEWTLKKDYWEFQEEFEALEETEKLSLEVQERLQKLEQLKKKTDKIKDFNFKNLWL